MQVQRIGKYKSAGDQILRKDMSAPQREQLSALLEDIHDELVSTVAKVAFCPVACDVTVLSELFGVGSEHVMRARIARRDSHRSDQLYGATCCALTLTPRRVKQYRLEAERPPHAWPRSEDHPHQHTRSACPAATPCLRTDSSCPRTGST